MKRIVVWSSSFIEFFEDIEKAREYALQELIPFADGDPMTVTDPARFACPAHDLQAVKKLTLNYLGEQFSVPFKNLDGKQDLLNIALLEIK